MRFGVSVAAVLVAVGFLMLLLHPGVPGTAMSGLREMAGGLLRLDAIAVINLGLLVLIGTSVFRVAAAALAFAAEGDYPHALISGLVLGILIMSFALGKVE